MRLTCGGLHASPFESVRSCRGPPSDPAAVMPRTHRCTSQRDESAGACRSSRWFGPGLDYCRSTASSANWVTPKAARLSGARIAMFTIAANR